MHWFNPSTAPIRAFEDHYQAVLAVAVLPDRQRMVTASSDSWLRIWDLRSGTLLKMMAGHKSEVWALAVSRDGQLIASGDEKGEVIAWHGATGEFLIQAIKSQFGIISMDFSPSGTVLATVSMDRKAKLWDTKTWQLQGKPITCYDRVFCVRYSPSGERIATASIIEIYHPETRHRVAKFSSHGSYNCSLTWTPDGTGLLSSGNYEDPTIREWDASTWEQVGDAWEGHTNDVNVIAIHPAGTLVASASDDKQVRLWRLSDGHTISIFQHSDRVCCVTFSVDGEHILSGGDDEKISEWAVPKDALSKDVPKSKAQSFDLKILIITTSACDALLMGGLSTAEKIVTQEITANLRDYTSYATRSIVRARKLNWDDALQDANESLRINPSLTGYIAKGIALCGKRQFRDATKVFDLAFTSTDGNSTTHLLFLIKAIALFNANKHEEAMLRVQELVTDFPDIDPLACSVVETNLHVQLGTIALSSWCHKGQAVNHFTSAVSASALFSKSSIHRMYGDFTVLFGWDLESLWLTARKQLCYALIRVGKFGEAYTAFESMMDACDETIRPSLRAWFAAF